MVFVFYGEAEGDFFGCVACFPRCDEDGFEICDAGYGVVGNAGVVAVPFWRRAWEVLDLAALKMA